MPGPKVVKGLICPDLRVRSGLKDPGPQIQKLWYRYAFCWWKDQLVNAFQLRLTHKHYWTAEANFTQYHPLGHIILLERMHCSLYSLCLCVINSLNTCCLHLICLLSFVAHSLLCFFQEKEKEKQKVSLARLYFWDRCVRALLSPRWSCWGPHFEDPIVFWNSFCKLSKLYCKCKWEQWGMYIFTVL